MTVTAHIDVLQCKENGGYGSGNNRGIQYAWNQYQADLVIVSNPDVEFSDGLVKRMIHFHEKNSNVAIVAPRMKHTDGSYARNTAWRIPKNKWGFLFSDVPVINRVFAKSYLYKIQNGKKVFVLMPLPDYFL